MAAVCFCIAGQVSTLPFKIVGQRPCTDLHRYLCVNSLSASSSSRPSSRTKTRQASHSGLRGWYATYATPTTSRQSGPSLCLCECLLGQSAVIVKRYGRFRAVKARQCDDSSLPKTSHCHCCHVSYDGSLALYPRSTVRLSTLPRLLYTRATQR